MNEALLRAICDRPGDDDVRLVLADWLEEHRQTSRAELIRVQIQQSRLDSHDPHAHNLAIRASTLLAEHERGWLGEWAGQLVDWTFARGFLDAVTLEPEVFLQHGERLFAEHPVRQVRFVGDNGQACGPDVVEELASHPAFVHVRSLDASGSRHSAGPAWCRALAARSHLKAIEELDFSGQMRRDETFHDLSALAQLGRASHLEGLRHLKLNFPQSATPLHHEVVTHITEACFATSLRTLELRGAELTAGAVRRLVGSERLANLESLDLGWCDQLRPESIREVLSSPHLSNLRHLGLGGIFDLAELACYPLPRHLNSLHLCSNLQRNQGVISAANWRDLGRSGKLRKVRELFLLYNLIDEDGAKELFTAPGAPRLRALMIMGMSGNGDELARVVTAARSLRDLTHLELPACRITPAGNALLLKAPFVPNLRVFCVAGNGIADEGVLEFIGSALEAGQLGDLHLHHCDLAPEVYEQLFAWQGLRHVERMDLSGSALSRQGVRALFSSPYLDRVTEISVCGGAMSEEGLQELATFQGVGLPRLRSLSLHGLVSANEVFLLRQRFGARVRIES